MTRILTALCLFAVVLPVLIFSHTPVLPAFLGVVGVMCIWEITKCKGIHKKLYLVVPAALFVLATPFLARVSIKILFALLVVFAVYIYFAGVFFYGKTNIDEISYVTFFALFIALGVFSVTYLRDNASKLYLLAFVSPWVSDAAAMYTGKLFGKKKLCPNISPKKTVAGAIGSTLGTVITFLVYVFIINTWFGGEYNYILFGLIAIPFGVVIQLGDLSASVVKRYFGVKDYGNLLPGHGGVMDRCDSILPTAILGCALCILFK